MRLVVVGVGFANKGAEAMLKTVRTELERRVGPSSFIVWDALPLEAAQADESGFETLLASTPTGPIAKAGWLVRQCARHPAILAPSIGGLSPLGLLIRAKGYEMVDLLGEFDAVLDASGFAYGDGLGIHSMTLVEPLARSAARRGKPYVFLPQAWGPFSDGETRRSITALLGMPLAFAYARDSASLAYLRQVCDEAHCDARSREDIAFSLGGFSEDAGLRVLETMGCTGSRPIVGLAPNMRAFRRTGRTTDGSPYVEALAVLGRTAVDELDADVVLQANEIKVGKSHEDDRRLCEMIALEIDRPGRVFFSNDVLSAEESKSVIGRCEFLFASRFHSLVFALSQSVPCAALGWSHKYAELLRPFGLEDAGGSIGDSSPAAVRQLLLDGWAHRRETRRRIAEHLGAVARDNATLFDEIAARVDAGRTVGEPQPRPVTLHEKSVDMDSGRP